MRATVLTPAAVKFIEDNRLRLSCVQMAAKLGCSRTPIQRYLTANNLRPAVEVVTGFRIRATKGKTKLTPEQDAIIMARYLVTSIKQLASLFGVSYTCVRKRINYLGLVKPGKIGRPRKVPAKEIKVKPERVKAAKVSPVKVSDVKRPVRKRPQSGGAIKLPDLTGKVLVRLNSKTSVYVTPGDDIAAIKKRLNII